MPGHGCLCVYVARGLVLSAPLKIFRILAYERVVHFMKACPSVVPVGVGLKALCAALHALHSAQRPFHFQFAPRLVLPCIADCLQILLPYFVSVLTLVLGHFASVAALVWVLWKGALWVHLPHI